MLLTQCDFCAQCSDCQRGEKSKQARVNGGSRHVSLKVPHDVSTSALNVKVNEIQTSVGESSFGSGRVCSEFSK